MGGGFVGIGVQHDEAVGAEDGCGGGGCLGGGRGGFCFVFQHVGQAELVARHGKVHAAEQFAVDERAVQHAAASVHAQAVAQRV